MKSSTEYEQMVAKLLSTRLRAASVAVFEAQHLASLKGRSGQSHEFDVLFQARLGDLRLLMVVECKCYKRRVGPDVIASFAYRMRDVGAHKGIVVTTTGFTSGACRVAESEGIGLLVAAQGRLLSTCLPGVAEPHPTAMVSLQLVIPPDRPDLLLCGELGRFSLVCGLYDARQDRAQAEMVFLLPCEATFLGIDVDVIKPSQRDQCLPRRITAQHGIVEIV